MEIRIATTPEEKEAVYRFRYPIYVEEMGHCRDTADHEHRRLEDPEDDRSWIVYATDGEEVVGSFRVTWGGVGFSERQIEQYHLAPFLAEIPAERLVVGERTMILPSWRGVDLFPQLGEGSAPLTASHDVRIVFGACEPHLLSFYGRFQRPYAPRNINTREGHFLIPLITFPQGEEALTEFGRDGALPDCVAQAMTSTGTVTSPMFAGEGPYLDAVVGEIGLLGPSLFDGLSEAELAACLRRSNVITCRAGDRLVKAGGGARNVYVVLDGALRVSRDGHAVGHILPGEVAGEMAYLLEQSRAFDVDVAEDETMVLSLSERTIRRLQDEHPAGAARLMANLSKLLCRRLEHATA